MSKPIEEAVQRILLSAINEASETGKFLPDQIPELVSQLLRWEFTSSLIIFFIFLTVAGLTVFFFTRWMRAGFPDDESLGLPFVIAIVATAIVLIAAANRLFIWLQIWLSPKLFLLEYATALAK